MKEQINSLNDAPWFSHLLIGIWLVLNIWQAASTELFHDEAYYWMFSQHLAWGYAEHAPLIAALIHIGSLLFDNEFGVRFFPVIMNGIVIYLITKLVQPKQKILWFLLVFSVFEVHIGGFFAAPDAPLIFFTTLFLFFYRRFLNSDSWKDALLVGLAVIGMLYSKYHGIMILGCTLLSNISLLKNKKFWAIVIGATVAWSPVLMWLIDQRFQAFTFHLLNRVKTPNNGMFTVNYVLSQFLVMGPLVGCLIIPAACLFRVRSQFERALKFCALGILGFLFLLSFKTWIEANWSASALIPIMILGYFYIETRPQWTRATYILGLISLSLLLIFRLSLVYPFLPRSIDIRNEVHGWDSWAHQLNEIAGEQEVVFFNSYQHASKYAYYTKEKTHSLNNFFYHANQYDNWEGEARLQGKDVTFFSRYPLPAMDTIETATGEPYYFKQIPNYTTYNKVKISAGLQENFNSGETVSIPITLTHTYRDSMIRLDRNPDMRPILTCNVFQQGKWVAQYEAADPILAQSLSDSLQTEFLFTPTLSSGEYEVIFSIKAGWLDGSINGAFQAITIR